MLTGAPQDLAPNSNSNFVEDHLTEDASPLTADSRIKPDMTTTATTSTTKLAVPVDARSGSGNTGIIAHIQKLIELITSKMEKIQAQLAAQSSVLKSIIETSMASENFLKLNYY